MTLDEIIKNRYSVRKFADKEVKKEDILACLEAARLAPSSCNSQPTHFYVLQNEAKDKFADAVFTKLYYPCKFFKKAPVLVAVCVDKEANMAVKTGQKITGRPFYMTDQAIAAEHFILKATELGLGTCWVGWFNSKKAAEFLNLKDNFEVHNLIALGYAEAENAPRPKITRKKLEEISTFLG